MAALLPTEEPPYISMLSLMPFSLKSFCHRLIPFTEK